VLELVRCVLHFCVFCCVSFPEYYETHDQYFFQLNTCGHSPYVTPCLTRGWVCRLQLLQSFLTQSPAGLITTFYCLRFEAAQTCRVRSRDYIPQEQGGPVKLPGTGFFLCPRPRHAASVLSIIKEKDRTENKPNSYSIVACVFVAAGMCQLTIT
jgi:hypothetical protein